MKPTTAFFDVIRHSLASPLSSLLAFASNMSTRVDVRQPPTEKQERKSAGRQQKMYFSLPFISSCNEEEGREVGGKTLAATQSRAHRLATGTSAAATRRQLRQGSSGILAATEGILRTTHSLLLPLFLPSFLTVTPHQQRQQQQEFQRQREYVFGSLLAYFPFPSLFLRERNLLSEQDYLFLCCRHF